MFVLFTVGQYAVAWASYFEKKLTIEEVFTSRLRKLQRKVKKKKRDDLQDVHDVQEEIEQLLQRPSYKNTLPYVVPTVFYSHSSWEFFQVLSQDIVNIDGCICPVSQICVYIIF